MINSKETHLFPGGNTSKGFYSFYRYVLTQKEANRIICLKGGPGTGKSSMMKKIGKHFLDKGYSVEFHHCSSDNNSLDGVVVKELKVAVLDGTAPHIVDPINPGAVDEIVNLGVALDADKLMKNKNEIIKLNTAIGKNFGRAYKYLAAAKSVHEDWSSLNNEALDSMKINNLISTLKSEILKIPLNSTIGVDRHLFSTAFTPNGIVSYGNELANTVNNLYVLKGGPGFRKTDVLNEIGSQAQDLGYFVLYLHDPFIPERLENIIIPELSTGIFTTNEISNQVYNGKVFVMSDYCSSPSSLDNKKEELEECSKHFYTLINKALTLIPESKKLHDALEVYYIDAMDFNIVNSIYDEVIKKIEKYEQS
ncbi:MAG: PRK06851 family protein [Clostridium sp.]